MEPALKALDWRDLNSSNLSAVAYHEPTKTLAVRFNSGALYSYMNADEEYFTGLQTAVSAGQYLNTVVKIMCPYTRWQDEAELIAHVNLSR